jgi:hypothetical protein
MASAFRAYLVAMKELRERRKNLVLATIKKIEMRKAEKILAGLKQTS